MRAAVRVLLGMLCAMSIGAGVAQAAGTFHPRVKGALGLVPPLDSHGARGAGLDPGSSLQVPVTYHAGTVMQGGITVHEIFWSPTGHSFTNGYQADITQFFGDIAAASGASDNIF